MIDLLTHALSLALALYTALSYPPAWVGLAAGGSGLLAAGLAAAQRALPRFSSAPATRGPASMRVFLVVVSAVSALQATAARPLFGPRFSVDRATGYPVWVWLAHAAVVAAIVLAKREHMPSVTLGVAALYTSILYSPAFAAPEAAPPFVALAALALAAFQYAFEIAPGGPVAGRPPAWTRKAISAWALPAALFTALVLAASLASDAPHESLVWMRKWLVLLAFVLLVPLWVDSPAGWLRLARIVVLAGVLIPVGVSAIKLLDMGWQVSLRAAWSYRLLINELGRSNLIARTLLAGGPLLVALALTARRRAQRALYWGLAGLALAVLAACRSWGGWVGVALTGACVAVVRFGGPCVAWWRARPPLLRVALPVLAAAGVGLALVAALWLAPQLNVESFNGRLHHWRIALLDLAHHPWLGVGPGHHLSQARYAGEVGWMVDTQATLDDPGRTTDLLRLYAVMHTHNLWTEIAVGTGLPGLAAFVWLLVALLRVGLQARARLRGNARVWVTGCLAGVVASLGWGLLDVMEISPPFLTFPTWALVGLLLAAPRAFRLPAQEAARPGARPNAPPGPALCRALLGSLVFPAVLVPSLASLHYRAAFSAYQERRWETAAAEAARAGCWEPRHAPAQDMRAMALINLGRYEEATAEYERALRSREGFAPYHAQLGWLYWLAGDLERATAHLEQAVQADPREAWRPGLNGELGLAYVAQGRVEAARPLFQTSIELEPESAAAPYWVRVVRPDRGYDVVLDPAYLPAGSGAQAGPPGPALQARILAHLGKIDHTPRLFEVALDVLGPLSLNQVLDAIEAGHAAARAAGSGQAPRLLAAAAEAAQRAGLHGRAKDAYRAFQEAYPDSAYGFRGLGVLYRVQGRADDARAMLQTALQASARDAASWRALAELEIDQAHWAAARQALDAFQSLLPLAPEGYAQRARLARERGAPEAASRALGQVLYIQDSVSDRLALAGLYRQLEQPRQAARQCDRAAAALLDAHPRLLDVQLRQVGRCLAASGRETPRVAAGDPHSAVRHVLQGHVYDARGQYPLALAAYRRAADALQASGAPGAGAATYFVGEAHRVQGELEAAERAFQEAARLDPLESLPLLALAQLQASQGRPQAAVENLRSAVRATPGCEAAHVALGNALLAGRDREGAARHYRLAQRLAGDVDDRILYDLAAHLAGAEVQAGELGYVRNGAFTIDGVRRRVVLAHPESRIAYEVPLRGPSVLVFDVAVDPASWGEAGDGVTFRVTVGPGAGQAGGAGGERVLWTRYIDPKANPADRRWHSFALDLAAYSGRTVSIVFETDAGPAGDPCYDWAGWGAPRLLGESEGAWARAPD